MFGGTVDKLTLLTNLIGHTVFFFGWFLAVIFVEAPAITRALLLFLVPVNLLLTMQQSEFSLDFLEMSWILAGSVPGTVFSLSISFFDIFLITKSLSDVVQHLFIYELTYYYFEKSDIVWIIFCFQFF